MARPDATAGVPHRLLSARGGRNLTRWPRVSQFCARPPGASGCPAGHPWREPSAAAAGPAPKRDERIRCRSNTARRWRRRGRPPVGGARHPWREPVAVAQCHRQRDDCIRSGSSTLGGGGVAEVAQVVMAGSVTRHTPSLAGTIRRCNRCRRRVRRMDPKSNIQTPTAVGVVAEGVVSDPATASWEVIPGGYHPRSPLPPPNESNRLRSWAGTGRRRRRHRTIERESIDLPEAVGHSVELPTCVDPKTRHRCRGVPELAVCSFTSITVASAGLMDRARNDHIRLLMMSAKKYRPV